MFRYVRSIMASSSISLVNHSKLNDGNQYDQNLNIGIPGIRYAKVELYKFHHTDSGFVVDL